jgi:hypothetical protein
MPVMRRVLMTIAIGAMTGASMAVVFPPKDLSAGSKCWCETGGTGANVCSGPDLCIPGAGGCEIKCATM